MPSLSAIVIRKTLAPFFLPLAVFLSVNLCAAAGYQPVDREIASDNPKPAASQPTKKTEEQKKARAAASEITYISPSGKHKLFGTIELGKPMDSIPIWKDVLRRNLAKPIFQPERYFSKKTTWQELKSQAEGKSDLDKLRLVNTFWNRRPYITDMKNWNKQDYWAIPEQFLRKSGDCEDYAIIKYFTLKELGIDPAKMRIVVVWNGILNEQHAILAVYLDNDVYILDNLSDIVLSHRRVRTYLPKVSVNESGCWAHIMPKPKHK